LKKSMFRKLSLFIIALLCFCPKTARPMDSVRVMVLPFEIHAIGDLSYLKEEILAVITNHLKQEGAAILAPGTIPDFTSGETTESFDQIRNLGIKNGADYVVWGSFTLIGQQFSLDAKVIESFGESPPRVFIKEGQGIENLSGTVKQLVRDIGMKLFKREKVPFRGP